MFITSSRRSSSSTASHYLRNKFAARPAGRAAIVPFPEGAVLRGFKPRPVVGCRLQALTSPTLTRLFLPHPVEQDNPDLDVPDRAFFEF